MGPDPPTFLKYGSRDLFKNDIKLVRGGGGNIQYACVKNNNCKIHCY